MVVVVFVFGFEVVVFGVVWVVVVVVVEVVGVSEEL